MFFIKRLLVILVAAIILHGCGIGYRNPHKPEQFPPANPTPHQLPISRYGNPSSYEVHGKTYHLLPTNQGYTERGVASWYGEKFHGRRASCGETYNMYAMTAAHKTLPIPVYAQVTNLENGRKIIVKINDRGPFVKNRLIDLSYAAATKLGIVGKGTAPVEVTTIIPDTSSIAQSTPAPQETVKPKLVNIPKPPTNINTKAITPLTQATKIEINSVSDDANTSASPSSKIKNKPEQNNAQSAQNIAYFLQIGAFGDKNNALRLIDRVKVHLNENFTIDSVTNGTNLIHKVKIGPIETIKKADLLIDELEGFELGTPRLIIAN